MTALIPEGLEPLATWDEADPEWRDGGLSARFMWLTQTPIVHVYRTRRIEFYLLDTPFAVIYRYQRDAGGYVTRDRHLDGLAEDEPVIVPLAGLPPAHLLKG